MKVNELLGDARLGRFHIMLLISCCLVVVFDMYDLMIYASVLPLLMQEWGIDAVSAGAIGSYGIFGMMVGAILFGSLADKFGRKSMLVTSIAVFSVATALCAAADGPTMFGILRFVAGVGIGGILPSSIAMLTDYVPTGFANRAVGILTCFFSVGGIVAALVAMLVIPTLGWQACYLVAVVPLICLPFMMRYFNDSPAMLIAKGQSEKLRSIVEQITGRDIQSELRWEIAATEDQSAPLKSLFTGKRALGTLMIWVAFFMCLLMINGVSTWLPQLMMKSGYALNSSQTFMVMLNLGAIVGTLVMGGFADKWGVKRVLVPMFVISAVALTLLGFGSGTVALMILTAVAGACTMGAQNISYAFASLYYPAYMRSTAIGLASGVGRLGGIIGPTFGGIVLAMNGPVQLSFVSFAIPGILAAIAFAFVPLGAQRRAAGGAKRSEEKSTA